MFLALINQYGWVAVVFTFLYLIREVKGINAKIDKGEIILNSIKDRVTKIEVEVGLEKRMSEIEKAQATT